ncbi:MAG: AraC family ligand binding domain-containing protein, partial [Pseudomonadota bacterium]
MSISQETRIPAPAVYGTQRLATEIDDVHVECLAASLLRHEYRIRRHRHSDLFQFFVIHNGIADCQLDAQHVQINGSGLLVVPAMVVHQFAFTPSASGQVVSVSHALLREFERLSGETGWLSDLATPRWIELADGHSVFQAGEALWDQFTASPRRRLQVTTAALRLVSDVVAVCESHAEKAVMVPSSHQQLVDAFLEDIEKHYASDDSIGDYCRRLKVTERTLRRATTACMKLSPIVLVHQRKCLEAQRLLR